MPKRISKFAYRLKFYLTQTGPNRVEVVMKLEEAPVEQWLRRLTSGRIYLGSNLALEQFHLCRKCKGASGVGYEKPPP